MNFKSLVLVAITSITISHSTSAQNKDSVFIQSIVKEATDNSQLQNLAHELLDQIGPRLVGTPNMQKANDWAVDTYKKWGISAKNEKWGEWRGWERGISHIDMVHPRVKSLEGMQLAWSPATKGTLTAETIIIADVADSIAFGNWLPTVKGKFVLLSMMQPTGMPYHKWKQFGLKE